MTLVGMKQKILAAVTMAILSCQLAPGGVAAAQEPDARPQAAADTAPSGAAPSGATPTGATAANAQSASAQAIEEVRQSGILQRARKKGDDAPQGEVLDHRGEQVDFQSLWANGPVVVVFYRGGWCPMCNRHLAEMQAAKDDILAAGAALVAIAPELPEKARETAKRQELKFPVYTDKGNRLAEAFRIAYRLPRVLLPTYRERYGVAEYNGDESYELPLAATYLIDSEGKIRYAFLDANYKKRAEPKEVITAVKQLDAE